MRYFNEYLLKNGHKSNDFVPKCTWIDLFGLPMMIYIN